MAIIPVSDDGLYTPDIKLHSIKKIEAHNKVVQVFSTAMRIKWPQRLYLGLYSGSGRARLPDGKIIESTPMGALRVSHPFTNYIFVDNDERCIEALTRRIEAIGMEGSSIVFTGDVNSDIDEILDLFPSFSKKNGLISFCFMDPFSISVKYDTIAKLSQYKIDILILLALGMDARQNFKRYYEDKENSRIADLINNPDWRKDFRKDGVSKGRRITWLFRYFDSKMRELGYKAGEPVAVDISGKGVNLYHLVLYSKHKLGRKFWDEVGAAGSQFSMFPAGGT